MYKNKRLFGAERLQKTLNQSKGDAISYVRNSIRRFTKDAEQSDDITMMEIVFKK